MPTAAGDTEAAPDTGAPARAGDASDAALKQGEPASTKPAKKNTQNKQREQKGRSAALLIAVRTIAGVLLLVIAFGFLRALAASAPQNVSDPRAEQPTLVPTMTATEMPVAKRWRVFGTARALRSATLAAEVSGIVIEKPARIEEGETVDEGELIARIRDDEYQRALEAIERRKSALEAQLAQLDVEEASLERRVELAEEAADLARAEFERAERARERGAGSASEVDLARSSLTVALRDAQVTREALAIIPARRANLEAQILGEEANEQRAEIDLERTRIRSPFEGRIQEVLFEEDERVAPGQELVKIVDPSVIEVPLKVAVSAASEIARGDTVTLRTTGESGLSWQGTIARVAPEADPTDRTITAYAIIEQTIEPGGSIGLKPGQFLTGEIIASRGEPKLVVPRRAVRDDDTVLVIGDDGTAEVRRIYPELSIEEPEAFNDLVPGETQWLVLGEPAGSYRPGAALAAGETVILSRSTKVFVGESVTPASREQLLAGDGGVLDPPPVDAPAGGADNERSANGDRPNAGSADR
jgi:multidrug efflux pump subunit AcrA (membrane-fusion protein)